MARFKLSAVANIISAESYGVRTTSFIINMLCAKRRPIDASKHCTPHYQRNKRHSVYCPVRADVCAAAETILSHPPYNSFHEACGCASTTP